MGKKLVKVICIPTITKMNIKFFKPANVLLSHSGHAMHSCSPYLNTTIILHVYITFQRLFSKWTSVYLPYNKDSITNSFLRPEYKLQIIDYYFLTDPSFWHNSPSPSPSLRAATALLLCNSYTPLGLHSLYKWVAKYYISSHRESTIKLHHSVNNHTEYSLKLKEASMWIGNVQYCTTLYTVRKWINLLAVWLTITTFSGTRR